MKDILLKEGDLYLDENGDIVFTDSISQSINIRLRWFYGEWLFAPDCGLKYFEDVLVKNPDLDHIKMLVSQQIGKVDGVKSVKSVDIEYDRMTRNMCVRYVAITDQETLRGEVELWSSTV